MAVELHHPQAKPLAHSSIEGGGNLDPRAIDIEIIIAVKGEKIRSHHIPQLVRHKVIPDISKDQARRYAAGAGECSKENSLLNAKAFPSFEYLAGTVMFRAVEGSVRIVRNVVPHEVEDSPGHVMGVSLG